MDSITTTASELDAAINDLHDMVQAVILASTTTEKKKAELAARPTLREARNKLFALRAETRRITDIELKSKFEAICIERDQKLRNYDTEMKQQIYGHRETERPKTFQEKREIEMMGPGGVDASGFNDATQVLHAATNVQKDAIESLQRTERLQNVTEESGKATLIMLQHQTEQMYQVDEELRNLQGVLDRASRDIKWFYRQLAGDKCFITIFGLLILALLALVFIAVWTRRRKERS